MISHLSEFESPLPHKKNNLKPAPVAGFIIEQKNSARTMSIINQYRKPRIVKGKAGWYITYYYRVPSHIRHLFTSDFCRFRLTEDMNRRKGEDREQYANWLLGSIEDSLKQGYNPFINDQRYVEAISSELPTEMSCEEAFDLFLETWKKRGLESSSLAKYKKCVNRLASWLHARKMLNENIKSIKTTHIEAFLNDGRKEYGFSNREYNNTFDFIRTCFNFLVKKDIIAKSPCAGIDKLKTNTTKHRFYDAASLKAVTKALLASDPYTYLACQTVYYLCIRSDKELMNFRVGNILWDQNKILLDAKGTKGKSARYVPMDDNIKKLFLDRGIDKYPPEYFVFGIKGKPSSLPFGTGFFAKRFRKVRDAADLPDTYTIYSMKHTRIIHLKQDGLSDSDIMSLTGHKDFVAYARYLRDLGLDANPEKINKVSRKV